MRWLAPLLLCSGCALAIGLDDYRSGGEGGATAASSAQASAGGAGQGGGGQASTATQGGGVTSAGGGSLKALGEACGVAAECASGFCVDSVCCDSSCSRACEKCDGSGACVVEDATVTCGAYYCNGIDTMCPISCDDASDCASSYWCDLGGTYQCVTDNSGADCNVGSDCTYGECDGGVCCNQMSTPCSGECRSCNNLHTGFGDGFCGFITSGDPEGECATSCGSNCVCNGMGSCASPS